MALSFVFHLLNLVISALPRDEGSLLLLGQLPNTFLPLDTCYVSKVQNKNRYYKMISDKCMYVYLKEFDFIIFTNHYLITVL